MKVDYVNHMGDDLLVVNAARVSFSQESKYNLEEIVGEDGHGIFLEYKKVLSERDQKLIKYLATHNHWTPFSHPQISLRVKAPIFVRTQLFKHKVGMTENEVSRRYVDDTPEFFKPDVWRHRPLDGAKQGSDKAITVGGYDDPYCIFLDYALTLYDSMISSGVAPEQARMVLPQSMYTSWYWTGSLSAYSRICKLRLDAHAQAETREIAQMISDIVEPLFPHSWEALTADSKN